jgi:hypothetical protein
MNMKAYALLLLLSLAAAAGGVLTLLPAAGASYENVLGYRSLCTFAPAATLFCFGIAGATCVLRASLVKRRAQFGRPVFKAAPIAVVSILLILGFAATGWFISEKRQYIDGSTAATIALDR